MDQNFEILEKRGGYRERDKHGLIVLWALLGLQWPTTQHNPVKPSTILRKRLPQEDLLRVLTDPPQRKKKKKNQWKNTTLRNKDVEGREREREREINNLIQPDLDSIVSQQSFLELVLDNWSNVNSQSTPNLGRWIVM